MNGQFGGYRADPIAENHRRHEDRRRQEAMDARVTRFIGLELLGLSFRSLELLTTTARSAAAAFVGRELSENTGRVDHALLRRALGRRSAPCGSRPRLLAR
jgi:hypothetical protein